MRHRIVILSLLLATLAAFSAKNVIDSDRQPEFLYVLSMEKGTIDRDIITLKGINSVVYFSDRPYRVAGHMHLSEFGSIWTAEDMENDPPNATLSILDNADNIEIVIEILEVPMVNGRDISFHFRVLKGELPGRKFGVASLFVNTCSTPTNGQVTD